MKLSGKKIQTFLFVFLFFLASFTLYNPFLKSTNVIFDTFFSGICIVIFCILLYFGVYFISENTTFFNICSFIISLSMSVFYTQTFFVKIRTSANIYSDLPFILMGLFIILALSFYISKNCNCIIYTCILTGIPMFCLMLISFLAIFSTKLPKFYQILSFQDPCYDFLKFSLYIVPDIFICIYLLFQDKQNKLSFKTYFFAVIFLVITVILNCYKYLCVFGQNGLLNISYPDKVIFSLIPKTNMQEFFTVTNSCAYFIKLSCYSYCLVDSAKKLISKFKLCIKNLPFFIFTISFVICALFVTRYNVALSFYIEILSCFIILLCFFCTAKKFFSNFYTKKE